MRQYSLSDYELEDKTASMASPQDDSKIKALEAQVKSLKKELEDTTKRLDSVTKLSLQHESATAAEKKKYEHVVEENKLQYDNNGDLQSQLEEKEKEYKKLEQQWHTEVENGRLKDFELQKLHQKYKESSNRRSGPEEAQLKTKDETIASLKLDLSHSREELRTLRADYRKITQIRQDLGRENILLENDLIDRARELDRVQLENNTMEEERNQLLEMRDVVNDYFNLSVDLSPNALRHFLDDWLDEQKISPSGLSAKHARGASLADEIDKDEFEDESASSVEDEEQDKPSGEEEQGKETPDQGEPPKAALPSDGQPGKSSTATNERIIVKEASMRSKLATLLIIALLLWFILPQDRHVWLAANEYSRQSLISVRDGSMWMWLMASRPVLESRFMLEQLLDFDRGLLG